MTRVWTNNQPITVGQNKPCNLKPIRSAATALPSTECKAGGNEIPNSRKERSVFEVADFTGRPEEWPLFVSSFNNGNNWSNLEKLGSLQESIKRPAK